MADTQFGPHGWTPERLGSLAGRCYVITGANAGTGYEAARLFLSKGASVVMLNRSAEKSAAAIATLKAEHGAEADVRFIEMDLADLASVRRAAEEIRETVPRLDALICNAAIAQVPKQRLTVDVQRMPTYNTLTSTTPRASERAFATHCSMPALGRQK